MKHRKLIAVDHIFADITNLILAGGGGNSLLAFLAAVDLSATILPIASECSEASGFFVGRAPIGRAQDPCSSE
jgi:hypothetical protein